MRTNFEVIRYFDDGVWGSVGSGAATGATLGSIVPGIGTAIGGIVGAAGGLIAGLSQKSKAAKLAAANQYQPMGIPREELENQQIARNQSLQGLPSQQYDMAMKNIQRQQQASLSGAQDRRSGIGLIGSIQQNSNDATGNLDVANANARLQNQRQLLGVNSQVAGYRSRDWQQNEENRLRNYNYSQALLGAGNQNIIGAIDSGASALTGLYGKGLFGGGAGTQSNFRQRASQVTSPLATGSYSGPGDIQAPPLQSLNLGY